ncbi:hypothetical protein R1flu_011891 [Riccia fluitans]|uniref:Uncharacterized protein n=1 Tax=Riccia fluitans TaxID=41844 RepID=A0ABD1ZA85_9MARC
MANCLVSGTQHVRMNEAYGLLDAVRASGSVPWMIHKVSAVYRLFMDLDCTLSSVADSTRQPSTLAEKLFPRFLVSSFPEALVLTVHFIPEVGLTARTLKN